MYYVLQIFYGVNDGKIHCP